MPTYSYQCKKCSHKFDAFQGIQEDSLKKCPQCGDQSIERGIGEGSAVFQFKGSGFYITDYKDEGDKSPCPCGKEQDRCKE